MAGQAPSGSVPRGFVRAAAVFVIVAAVEAALVVLALATAIGAALERSSDLAKSSAAFVFSIFAVGYLGQNLVDQLTGNHADEVGTDLDGLRLTNWHDQPEAATTVTQEET